jgi:hypothetical protein
MFTDSRGIIWDVWNVDPQNAERRLGAADRRARSRGPDRRKRTPIEPRVRLSRPELTLGWLAFQARHEKRRLSPTPGDWELLDTKGLEQLLESATLVNPPRRLLE